MSDHSLTIELDTLLGQYGKGNGTNRAYLCPFHDEDTPSFSIHTEEGMWQCFGCGRTGNLEQLYRLMGEQPSEESRVNLLVRSVNREPERIPNFTALANACKSALAGRTGQSVWQHFIRTRPIARDAAQAFGVGYSDEKRALAFPYWRSDNTVCGIKYRHSNGGQSWETGSERYPLNLPDCEGKGIVLIAEGESDTLAAWSRLPADWGICGIAGAGVSEKTWRQWGLHLLFARRIYIAFDADEAGDSGSQNALRVLGDDRVTRIRPTRGKDISEHIMNGGTLAELDVEKANDPAGRIREAGRWVRWPTPNTNHNVASRYGGSSARPVPAQEHDRQYQPQS